MVFVKKKGAAWGWLKGNIEEIEEAESIEEIKFDKIREKFIKKLKEMNLPEKEDDISAIDVWSFIVIDNAKNCDSDVFFAYYYLRDKIVGLFRSPTELQKYLKEKRFTVDDFLELSSLKSEFIDTLNETLESLLKEYCGCKMK